ncbi:MAG: hypothetical protein GY797_32830 [Deltaproteobacteria bacterium]|nr:hypothetical protein [Deltaproteobacteria bacterium]
MSEYNKQLLFRVDEETHRKARIKAVTEGRYLSEILRELLWKWVSEDDEPQKENPDQ